MRNHLVVFNQSWLQFQVLYNQLSTSFQACAPTFTTLHDHYLCRCSFHNHNRRAQAQRQDTEAETMSQDASEKMNSLQPAFSKLVAPDAEAEF